MKKNKKESKKSRPPGAEKKITRAFLLEEASNASKRIEALASENLKLQADVRALTEKLENLDPANPAWVRLEHSLRNLARAQPTPRGALGSLLGALCLVALLLMVGIHSLGTDRELDRANARIGEMVEKGNALGERLEEVDARLAGLPVLLELAETSARSLEGAVAERTALRETVTDLQASTGALPGDLAGIRQATRELETHLEKLRQGVEPVENIERQLTRLDAARDGDGKAMQTMAQDLRQVVSSLTSLDSDLLAIRAEVLDLRQSLAILQRTVEGEKSEDGPRRVDY